MIDELDRSYLIDILSDELAPSTGLRTILCAVIQDSAFARELTMLDKPVMLITHAVNLCINDQWRHNPTWLSLLIDNPLLLHLRDADRRLQSISTQASRPAPVGVNAMNATVISSGTPFVNRRRLRDCLAFLETSAAQAQPILVINGDAKVGKSYSSEYVGHFTRSRDAEQRIVCHAIKFTPDLALGLGAAQLAHDLVCSLARPLDDEPSPDTNQKLYVRQLATWVLSEAVKTGSRHWFVMDGFRVDPMSPDTQRPRVDTLEFLVELSNLIISGCYVERCRLILTGFDRSMLAVDPGKVEEERVKPCTLDEARQCLDEIVARATVPLPADRIAPLVLDQLPKGADRMVELNMRLRVLGKAIKELPEILRLDPTVDAVDSIELLIMLLTDLPDGPGRMHAFEDRLQSMLDAASEDE